MTRLRLLDVFSTERQKNRVASFYEEHNNALTTFSKTTWDPPDLIR